MDYTIIVEIVETNSFILLERSDANPLLSFIFIILDNPFRNPP